MQPSAQYLAVVSFGTGLLLKYSLLIMPFVLLASLVLILAIAARTRGNALRKVAVLVVSLSMLVVLLPVSISLGYSIRHAAFASLAERSKPLLHAIERYKDRTRTYPDTLADLVPEYLGEVPRTDMAAYPEYIYSRNPDGKGFSIHIPESNGGFINLDEFRYSSNGEYPEYGKYWQLIGSWKYYHE